MMRKTPTFRRVGLVAKPGKCFPIAHVSFAVLAAYLIDRAGVDNVARRL
jgi:hypothetical protein